MADEVTRALYVTFATFTLKRSPMAFKKTPAELVRSVRKHLDFLCDESADEAMLKKSKEKLSVHIVSIKFALYGDAESKPREADVNRLVDELFASTLLLSLVTHQTLRDRSTQGRRTHMTSFSDSAKSLLSSTSAHILISSPFS